MSSNTTTVSFQEFMRRHDVHSLVGRTQALRRNEESERQLNDVYEETMRRKADRSKSALEEFRRKERKRQADERRRLAKQKKERNKEKDFIQKTLEKEHEFRVREALMSERGHNGRLLRAQQTRLRKMAVNASLRGSLNNRWSSLSNGAVQYLYALEKNRRRERIRQQQHRQAFGSSAAPLKRARQQSKEYFGDESDDEKDDDERDPATPSSPPPQKRKRTDTPTVPTSNQTANAVMKIVRNTAK